MNCRNEAKSFESLNMINETMFSMDAGQEKDSGSDADAILVQGESEDLQLIFTMHFAMFLLKIRENHWLPALVQDEIVSEVKSLLTLFDDNYKDSLAKVIQNTPAEITFKSGITDLLYQKNLLTRSLGLVGSNID